ncbi:hypothetical protein ACNQFZ_09750 [Schinkia sp. CFF1]
MGSNKEKFLDGPALALILVSVIIVPLFSAIPSWSLTIFVVNSCISIILILLSRYLYKKIQVEIRYNSLVNFLLQFSLGFYFVTPFLRVTFGSFLFFVPLLLYVLLIVLTLIKRELIYQAFSNPGESMLAKGTFVVFIVLMIVGSLTARSGHDMLILRLLDEKQGAFWVTGVMYVGGLFFTFISSAFLKKTDRVVYY